jgi:hypothetical protein
MSCQTASRTAVTPRPHLASLMYSLPVRRLKDILGRVIPDVTLGPVEELLHTQLARLYTLRMSDGRKLLLSFAPSQAVRLLRHESTMLSSEAILVSFITGTDHLSEAGGQPSSSIRSQPAPAELLNLVPKLLKHSANNREMAYPYSIFETTAGSSLSSLSVYLSLPERRLVDRQVGFMVRQLASMTSPSGTFGTVSRVLPDVFSASYNPRTSQTPESNGSKTWSEAFNLLLEGVFRDGEDMAVLLPYETIRTHYQRLSWRLDAVTIPRLLILDAGSETNVMIERSAEDGSADEASGGATLKGLRSWSQGVFGDPLLCNAFEDASEGFLEGWVEEGCLIEDPVGSNVRALIYRCFRAVVSIVTEYYRPQGDSSRRELDGRRKLTSALAELEKIDSVLSDSSKRRRSASRESDSAKRIKIEGEQA